MVMDQGNEMQRMMNGWPFGLGNMNPRIIRLMDAYSRPPSPPPPPQPYAASRFTRSLSFSSFSSSNLDTESTTSFFPDQSTSLGRLIGIRSTAKKRSCLYHELHLKEQAAANHERSDGVGAVSKVPTQNSQQGLCVPLLHHVVGRISRSRSSSRH